MSRDEFPEIRAESGDSEDVEILEVIGVDADAEVDPPAAEEVEAEAEELLLGFDDEEQPAPTAAPIPTTTRAGSASDRDMLLRLRADYDNLRKRIDREREEYELQASSELVARLLPVLDNLERAMSADAGSGEALRQGLVMIHKQLTEELGRDGLRGIESVGRKFDPNLHDAVATDPESEAPANTIIEEFQRGYLFRDRVLRHAMVRVATNGTDDGDSGEETR